MLTETIQFEDFDGKTVTETLNFNITKSELMDAEGLSLQARFEGLQEKFSGGARELTLPEVSELLDLVKTFMRISYGVRQEKDGRILFRKSADNWADFKSSAAYDAFLFSLFDNPEKANDFLLGILPNDLRVAAEKEVARLEAETPELPVAPPVLETAPATEVSDEDLLKMDPKEMTNEQLQRAFRLKLQG